MAPSKRPTTPPRPPVAPPQPETPPEPATVDEFSWDQLAAPIPMPVRATTGSIKVNVLESVHEAIRRIAEASLTINTARVAAKATSTAQRPRVNYHWDVQPIPSKEWGAKFVKALGKYAKYRPSEGDIPHASPDVAKGQVTVRTGEPMTYTHTDGQEPLACPEGTEGAFWGVRYSVRPLEQRGDAHRLPGSA